MKYCKKMQKHSLIGILAAGLIALSAAASDFPSKPIRIIVPSAPGGGLDITTRLVAQKMGEKLGQSVIVENRAGADTLTGTRLVKTAVPDGYTLLAQANGLTALPALKLDPGFNPSKDFTAIGMMSRAPQVMFVGSELPYRTVNDFARRAKAEPGRLTYASAGVGGPPHLGAALYMIHAGLETTHVPYKGNGAAMPDVAAGRVDTIFGSYSGGAPYIQGGRMRAVGVTGTKRLTALPDVPTFLEQGFNFTYYFWLGLVAPAGTPKDVVKRLADAVQFATGNVDVAERLSAEGAERVSLSPEEFQDYIVKETVQMERLMRELKIVKE